MFSFPWFRKGLVQWRMQPPVCAMPHQLSTPYLPLSRKVLALKTAFDPCPTASCPHFEHDALCGTLFPLSGVKRHAAVPGSWRYWRTNGELLALRLRLFFLVAPLFQVGREGACRTKGGMNGSTTKHGGEGMGGWRKPPPALIGCGGFGVS